MIEIKKYLCEICNTEYSEEEDCIRCEASHKSVKRIKKQVYYNIKGSNTFGYPDCIDVEMEDGKTARYQYLCR